MACARRIVCAPASEVPHLAFLDQILHRFGHIFDWHLRVNAVLIEKIDRVNAESLQRGFHGLLDVLRPAVQTRWMRIVRGVELESKLRRDHDMVTHRSESFAYKFFVQERTIDLRCIEEGDATLHGSPQDSNHLLPGSRHWPVTSAHSHAA
jgi:hypothetical protein